MPRQKALDEYPNALLHPTTSPTMLKTNSGRNRLNILGAYSPDDRSPISLEGWESCDAERVA